MLSNIKLCLKLCFLVIHVRVFANPTIHVFGDSHASFFFTNLKPVQIYEEANISYNSSNSIKQILCKIHYLSAVTMHRVGRDGLKFLDWKQYGIANGDIVVYVFGEIDNRCHIVKQRDLHHRDLTEITSTLIYKYLWSIEGNKKNFKNINVVILTPIAPGNDINPEFPNYGSLEDRILISQYLNKLLIDYCINKKILYLDLYSAFRNREGSISLVYTQDGCHLNPKYNYLVKDKLLTLVKDFIS